MADQMLTYWPSSRSIYEGSHTDRDPGLDSPQLLASMRKVDSSWKAELKSPELIKSAKQIKSADAIANDANLEHLQVIRLHEEIMGAPDQPFFLEQVSTVRNVDMLESHESWFYCICPYWDTLRLLILERGGSRCSVCGDAKPDMHIDHRRPHAAGGEF